MRLKYPFIILSAAAIISQGCKLTRHIPEGKHLVVSSKIHLNENKVHDYAGDLGELQSVVQQKPFRKIGGFIPFHLSVWNYANARSSEKKWANSILNYLKNTVGEAPVIFEPVLLEKSKEQLQKELQNNGYFDARVSAYSILGEKTAEQHFYVYTGPMYKIRRVSYAFEDTALVREFQSEVKTQLYPGQRFQTAKFEQERDRLTREMKDLGYYTFDKIHVIFDVDTNLKGEMVDVSIRLRNLRKTETVNGKDTVIATSHRKHYINEVSVNENFDSRNTNASELTTIEERGIIFLFKDKPYVRPVRITRNLFVKPGDQYTLSRTNYSYDRISALNNFRFIEMNYTPSEKDSSVALLDLRVNLTKAPRQSMSIETTGTNRSGNLGISAGLNYKNRNLFRGAEQFDWRIYGGLESQRTNSTATNEDNEVIENISVFNTYEFGTQLGITIPDFMFSKLNNRLPWVKEPKTNVSFSLDRQARPQYQRNLLNTTFQYTMRIRKRDQLVVAPVDLSVIELQKTAAFEQQLQRTNNSLLINSYNDHIIPAGRISYSYSSQDLNSRKNFHYYRINLESAGNILRAVSNPLGLKYNEARNSYMIDSIAFAQYVKLDLDLVKYANLTEGTKMVYRFFGGVGLPLTNLNALPFERSFFAGGSNGIRAWRARALGPGSLSDTATYGIDQVGEMQLEFNAEYRFKIVKQIEGALFTDMGNIWLLQYDPQRPGAHFRPQSFYKEMAIAPGAGLRLNFNFFVIRLDMGLQLKDPSLPEGERWLFQPKTLTRTYRSMANDTRQARGLSRVEPWDAPYRPETTFNLAIQYPF